LIKCFTSGAIVCAAAISADMNKNTAALFCQKLEQIITSHLKAEASELLNNKKLRQMSLALARFGKTRKTLVFSLLKKNGKLCLIPLLDSQTETLPPIILKKVKSVSIIYPNRLYSCAILAVTEFKHKRVKHPKLFAYSENHINGLKKARALAALRHLR